MSDLQWLWSYFNILEDEKEEELKWKARLDYIGWWINPQLAKSVMESEKYKDLHNENNNDFNGPHTQFVKGDLTVNDSFEEEMKRALAGSDSSNNFVELPGSDSVGNQFESQDEFIARVIANEQLLKEQMKNNNDKQLEQTLEEMGLNMDDIDFFESPDE